MISDLLKTIEGHLADFLIAKGVDSPVVIIERAVTSEFGEYSTNTAMRYAKQFSQNPLELAEELVAYLNEQNIDGIDKITAVKPGFINFHFALQVKLQHAQTVVEQGKGFGQLETLSGQKWVIEHTSPNPNKAMHLGHMRNNLVGMGIIRILQKSGAEVKSDAIYNNRGIAIAKLMYGFLAHKKKVAESPTEVAYWAEHKDEWLTPEDEKVKADIFVTECYVLAEKDITNNPEIEQQVRQMVIDWEAGEANTWQLWELVLGYAYTGIDKTLNRLGSHWDKVWYEHEHYKKGKDYVAEGLEKGVFQKLEDGAVLTNFEPDYKIPDTILLKKDGTSLYITQDIALTDLKKKEYQADKLVWVVGPEQSLALKQLFAVCEQLGIGKMSDFTHIPYGYVGLRDEDGSFLKMSSRTGTVVLIDDVIDQVAGTISKRFAEEDKHSPEKRSELSEKLALAAVKFAFLKSDRTQDLTFDIEQSVDVHGDSGMYVMYTYVRTQSILKKATDESVSELVVPEVVGSEAEILRSLLYFSDVIKKSTSDLSVHHVAQYMLEISSAFNSWYAQETILDDGEMVPYKITIVEAVGVCLQNGLALLGIETVDQI